MKIQGLIIVFIGIISLCCARPNEFVQFACQYFSGMFHGECLKVDGAWGSWGPFTLCSATCNSGIRNRTRECNNPPAANGGAECPNIDTDNIERETCNIAPCPVDGMWGGWTLFSGCSATCDVGTRVRTRVCDNPSPANNGAPCSTDPTGDTETANCGYDECPDTKCKKNDFVYDSDTSICIQLYTEKKTFADARTTCVRDGGFLFKMDKTAKINPALGIITDRKSDQASYFIGASDLGNNDVFMWHDGSRVTWIGKAPGASNQNCVRLVKSEQQMNETFCTNKFYFFCEISV